MLLLPTEVIDFQLFCLGGLALNINTVFLTQLIVTNIFKLLNPVYLLTEFTRKAFRKFSEKLSLLTQDQLNT